MSRIVSPGSNRPENNGPSRSQPFFVTEIIRQHGVRGLVALLAAALFAFIPLFFLCWFNFFRLQSILNVESGQRFVVKPGQQHDEQEREEPGETALLQICCDVPDSDGWQELLKDRDPARPNSPFNGSVYVRDESVYLRRNGFSDLPFVRLGPPPVSVWLPTGDYEILVIYRAPTGETRIDLPGKSFPWLTEFSVCSPEKGRKTIHRVPLPHYDRGNRDAQLVTGNIEEPVDRLPDPEELRNLLAGDLSISAIPSPGGYLLSLSEPTVYHQEGHRQCVQDYHELYAVPREWTRIQLVDLRNWLPGDDPITKLVKEKLSRLINRLGWREFLQGWACYVAAGISGLVMTRWGALLMVEPWRRRNLWQKTPVLLAIFVASATGWFVFQLLNE
jgi:hypothetical protein